MKNGAEETNKNRETMKTGAERRKENSLKTKAWPIGILCRASYCMGLTCFKAKCNCIYVYKAQGLRAI